MCAKLQNMNLIAFDIPEETAELSKWLEKELLGLDLAELVGNLIAIHSPDRENRPTLEQALGVQLPAVLENGLSILSKDDLEKLMKNPQLLFNLQESIVIEGGEYWNQISPTSEQLEISERVWDGVEQSKVEQSKNSTVKAASSSVPNLFTGRGALFSALAVAAAAVIVMFSTPSAPVKSGWGWNKPGALAAKVPANEYLASLADSAKEWYKKDPQTAESLKTRIQQFRNGCQTLIKAPHKQLAQVDKEWLVEKCKLWAEKLDAQIASLDEGEKFEVIKEQANGTVDKLIIALQKRSTVVT